MMLDGTGRSSGPQRRAGLVPPSFSGCCFSTDLPPSSSSDTPTPAWPPCQSHGCSPAPPLWPLTPLWLRGLELCRAWWRWSFSGQREQVYCLSAARSSSAPGTLPSPLLTPSAAPPLSPPRLHAARPLTSELNWSAVETVHECVAGYPGLGSSGSDCYRTCGVVWRWTSPPSSPLPLWCVFDTTWPRGLHTPAASCPRSLSCWRRCFHCLPPPSLLPLSQTWRSSLGHVQAWWLSRCPAGHQCLRWRSGTVWVCHSRSLVGGGRGAAGRRCTTASAAAKPRCCWRDRVLRWYGKACWSRWHRMEAGCYWCCHGYCCRSLAAPPGGPQTDCSAGMTSEHRPHPNASLSAWALDVTSDAWWSWEGRREDVMNIISLMFVQVFLISLVLISWYKNRLRRHDWQLRLTRNWLSVYMRVIPIIPSRTSTMTRLKCCRRLCFCTNCSFVTIILLHSTEREKYISYIFITQLLNSQQC